MSIKVFVNINISLTMLMTLCLNWKTRGWNIKKKITSTQDTDHNRQCVGHWQAHKTNKWRTQNGSVEDNICNRADFEKNYLRKNHFKFASYLNLSTFKIPSQLAKKTLLLNSVIKNCTQSQLGTDQQLLFTIFSQFCHSLVCY